VFWPLQLSSKVLGVPKDSKFPLLGMQVSSSHLLQSGVATEVMAKRRADNQIVNLILATKSQESPWITYVHVACYIPLKRYWRMLQFCFRPHLNQSFEKIIMSLQSCRSPNFRNCGTPKLGDLGQNDIWMQAPWPGTKNNIRGKVVAFPKSGPWWILWIYVCPWFICAPKMLQLHIN
jgi:hypothetical protein